MTSATITLPPVTPAFRDAVRELAMQIGWRNVAKSIAYGPVRGNGNGHKPQTGEDQEARILGVQERKEAEMYLAFDNPVLNWCGYRKVWRFRRPRQNYGALPERPRPTPVEQVTVSEHLSNILANRGIKVNKDKSGQWWADVEDEAWGADDWLTECFGDRYGQHPYTFDNALNLLRQADEARRCLKGR